MIVWALLLTARAQEPVDVPSEDPVTQAKQLFRNGATLYHEGNYDEAIRAFELAYELSREPKLLFDIANAQERKGDFAASYDTLNTYRIFAPDAERVTIERRLRSLEERIALARPASLAPVVVAPEPVPPVTPAPVLSVDLPRGNAAKWVLFGVGSGLAGASGVAAGVSYGVGRGLASDGDRAAYGTVQAWNNVSLVITGAAASAAVIGLALPGRRRAPDEPVEAR